MRKLSKGRWYIGKDPQERRRAAAQLVYMLLPADGSRLKFSDLRRQAKEHGLSSATLSKHLKKYVEKNLAVREVDGSTRPPTVYYSKTISRTMKEVHQSPPLSEFHLKRQPDGVARPRNIDFVGLKAKNPALATQALERFLRVEINLMLAYDFDAIKGSIESGDIEDFSLWLDAFSPSDLILGLCKLCLMHGDIADRAVSSLRNSWLAEAEKDAFALLDLLKSFS